MHFHRKPTTFVGQVNLKVQNLERSIDFYQEVIGFKVLEQTERKANLTADGKTVLLSIEQPNNVLPKQKRTLGFITLRFFFLNDLICLISCNILWKLACSLDHQTTLLVKPFI